jgi:hypothetical protein
MIFYSFIPILRSVRPIVVLALMVLFACEVRAQLSYSPYPIIFIHGLDSDDRKWSETVSALESIFGARDEGCVFHAMLNVYGDMTALEGRDGVLGTIDDDVLCQGMMLTSGRSLYSVNFMNSWNENKSAPVLKPYQNLWFVGSRESQSNESSIVKQGYALKRCIDAVLKATGAKKVILVGHSMGGLCAREYLQRRVDGVPRWWIDPYSADGHKVAKLVTIGTPHWGSNTMSVTTEKKNEIATSLPSVSSEAVRDLRYSYNNDKAGLYVYGGVESDINTSVLLNGYHNADVDCNGATDDVVTGIGEGLDGSLPLPEDVSYTWITSLWTPTGDLVVDIDRQWIYTSTRTPFPVGLADTLLTNKMHTSEAGDSLSILRGLDEPGGSMIDHAYELNLNKQYRGTITNRTGFNASDTDVFVCKVKPSAIRSGKLIVRLQDLMPRTQGRRYLETFLLDSNYYVLRDTVSDSWRSETILTLDSAEVRKSGGIIYVAVIGSAKPSEWMAPYQLSARYEYTQTSAVEDGLQDESHFDFQSNLSIDGIYPNPAADLITVQVGGTPLNTLHFTLYNSLGAHVELHDGSRFRVAIDKLFVDVSDQPPGVYTLVVRAPDGRSVSAKVVIVR